MTWILGFPRTLLHKISKVDILPKGFSDHNQIFLMLRKRFRGRLNETILQKKILKESKEKLNEYFNNNLSKGTDLMTAWKASNL